MILEENQNRAETKQRANPRCNKMRNSVQQAIMTTAEDSVLLPLASPCITHARSERRGGELKHSCIAASPTFPHSICDREPRTRRMVWCACLQQLVICLVARLSPDKGMCVCVWWCIARVWGRIRKLEKKRTSWRLFWC